MAKPTAGLFGPFGCYLCWNLQRWQGPSKEMYWRLAYLQSEANRVVIGLSELSLANAISFLHMLLCENLTGLVDQILANISCALLVM